MFPGYLFLERVGTEQSLAPVRSTRGCVGVVRFGAVPAEVPAQIIETLKHYNDAQRAMLVDDFSKMLSGTRLTMIGSGFTGHTAIFLRTDSSDRVRVLLQILGQPREIVVGREALRKPV